MEKAQSLVDFLTFLLNNGTSIDSVMSMKNGLLQGKTVEVNGKKVDLNTLPCLPKP